MKSMHAGIRAFVLTVTDFFYPPFKKIMPIQTFRYAACGGANTLLDISLFIICNEYILHKEPLSFPFFENKFITSYIASFLFSFCFSFPIGFYLNRYVVFPLANSEAKEQLIKYFAVVMFCLVLNYGFMKFFVEFFNWDHNLSKIVTTVFVVLFSYLAQKHFTFKLKDGTELIDELNL